MARDSLTPKQKLFAKEYLAQNLNATRAYLAVYTTTSEDTAGINASRLLRKQAMQDYLQILMREREKRTQITQDQVLQELAAIAFIPLEDEKIVSGKIRVADKNRALENLAKHLGLLNSIQQHKLTEAQIAHIEAKTVLLQGVKPDTGLLESLIEVLRDD